MTEYRSCQNCKEDFSIELEDFAFYSRLDVPPPNWCPNCRRMRRMAHRNDYCFYYRSCALCERKLVSIYSPDKSVPIYCNKCWWSDAWDPRVFARDIDLKKPFFPQFKELLDAVPALAILNDNNIASENCEYTNYFALGKNCYFTMNSWKVENCLYCYHMVDAKDMVDVMTVFRNCNNIYDSTFVGDCSSSRNIYNSTGLLNCAYCYDCRGCDSCFLSCGLRSKKYYFKNRSYTEEEYRKIIDSYRLDTWTGSQKARREFEEFIIAFPRRPAEFSNCVNCTGNYLVNSKNAIHCFNAVRVEDSKYFENGDTIKDSYDCHSGGEQELCYEGINPDNSYGTCFTSYCHKNRNVYYSDSCQTSEDLFGCVALMNAKYCILNKQYSKDEYVNLREALIEQMRIRGEWGEFFPIRLSRFAYNETLAMQDYPLSKDEAIRQGYAWQDELQFTKGKETQDWNSVPDSIQDVPDSIKDSILACTECGRNYRLIEQELLFYRRNNIPLPRQCFFCRLKDRLRFKKPVFLWQRNCDCQHESHGKDICQSSFQTSYSEGRPERVYCEACYLSAAVL